MSINCIIYLFRTNTWCSFLNVIRISLGVSLERNNIIFQLRLTLVQDMVTYSSPIWTKMYVENGFSLIRSAGCESKQSHSIQIRMLNSMHRVGRMTIYLHGVLLGSLLSGLLHESFCPIQYFFINNWYSSLPAFRHEWLIVHILLTWFIFQLSTCYHVYNEYV